MPVFNLVRNSRVFFTNNVDASTGVIPTSGATITTANTQELMVMDGFSFSQGTQQTVIQLNEAGNIPTRGQRAFNVSLDPVEFSFSTYLRPSGSATVSADEKVLWNALASGKVIDTTGVALGATTGFTRTGTSNVTASFTFSSANLTAGGIAVGDTVNVTGVTGTDAYEWNMPAVVTSITGTAAACTGMVLTYATAPAGTGAPAGGTTPTINLKTGAWTTLPAASPKTAYGQVTFADSNRNQLVKFGLYFVVDGIMYAIDNCSLDQASVEFGLDGIAMVAWTGKGTALRQLPSTAIITGALGTSTAFSGAGNATGSAAAANLTANFITNKLSTIQIIGSIHGASGTTYTLAITGGNLTIANNINYLTPEVLGVLNKPIGYFTGSRSITGNVTAYLKTGSGNSAQILSDILAASAIETKFFVQLEIGGLTNLTRVEFEMDGCMLQVPTVETGDIMSTTINFTAQGQDPIVANNTYDLAAVNDLAIRYYSAA